MRLLINLWSMQKQISDKVNNIFSYIMYWKEYNITLFHFYTRMYVQVC